MFIFSILVVYEHLPLTHSLGGGSVRFLPFSYLLSPSIGPAQSVEHENGERARFLP